MRGRYSSSTARSITTNSDGPSASMGRIGGNDCASGMKHYVPIMFLSARGLKSGYTSVATRPLPPRRLSAPPPTSEAYIRENIDSMRRTPEYVEGPEAWTRFETAMKRVVAVPHAEIQRRIEEQR